MTRFIDDSGFGAYFTEFKHTAWRLESRGGYASDRASEKYRRFLAGDELPDDSHRPWCANVRRQTAQGKRIERVRIVDQPPTDGQRFLLAAAASNIAAGEDIRFLWRADAEKLGLPAADFWLFDSHRALVLHFDQTDIYLGAELIHDPYIVEFCQVRDAAWHHAVRLGEFTEQVVSAG